MSIRRVTLLILLVALHLAAPVPGALAATINVQQGQSVQAAIASATDGDVIVVAQGTYVENLNFLGKALTV